MKRKINQNKRSWFQMKEVEIKNNIIYFNNLKNPKTVSIFIQLLKQGIKEGKKKFILDFSNITRIFPNTIVPITGIVEYYKNHNISFEIVENRTKNNKDLHINIEPIVYNSENLCNERHNIMTRVWKFTSSTDVNNLVKLYMDELQKSDHYYKGMLDSIEWSLYEVMDNVIQHSKIGYGFVMGQIHLTRKYIAFTIFDYGQGIYNSLKNTIHAPRNAIDAITMAIKEEITCDKSIGQGNGLYGLHSIIKQGRGKLVITSGNGAYFFNEQTPETLDKIEFISKEANCTTVDFQLDYSVNLSLDKALIFRGKEYKLVNVKLEDMEEGDHILFKIKEHSEGTGTRIAAKRLKNEIINIIEEQPKKIILDFTGITIFSSSFADELIAKLLMDLGLFQFNNIIQIKGLDKAQEKVLQRSVIQRFVEEYDSIQSMNEENA